MIRLTKLDGREVVINSDLIVMVESTPDTVVTLTTGDRLLVRESVEQVVDRAVAFRQRVLQGPGYMGPPAASPDFAERVGAATQERTRTPSQVFPTNADANRGGPDDPTGK